MSENQIEYELLESLFSSYHTNDFNIIVKNMYNFLKENTFTDNVIQYQLLKFFRDKHDYIQSEYNINFNQIKIIINQLIIDQLYESNDSVTINQVVTEALDSDDSDNSKDSKDSNDSKDSKDSNDSKDTIEIETETPSYQTPQSQMLVRVCSLLS
jgi:hypothetical protein